MLNLHLTLPVVVNMLRTIVSRDPERIGREDDGAGCVYATIKDGALVPICIIGQMFADMGLLRLLLTNPNDIEESHYTPSNLSSCGVGYGFWDTMAEFGINVDKDAQEFAHSVQSKQDLGTAWGAAFDTAVEQYRRQQQEELNDRLDVLFS